MLLPYVAIGAKVKTRCMGPWQFVADLVVRRMHLISSVFQLRFAQVCIFVMLENWFIAWIFEPSKKV